MQFSRGIVWLKVKVFYKQTNVSMVAQNEWLRKRGEETQRMSQSGEWAALT